jgi:pimeloyl-ACP methyl ester carboxylesterase
MYGLIGGPLPYGLNYSAGLDVLSECIRGLGPNFMALPTFGWSEWRKIVSDIREQSIDTRIVICGHSMGANQTAAVAAAVGGRAIDLIAAFDPTIWYPVRDLGANVKRAICFHSTNIFSPFGHGRLRAGENFRGKLETFDTDDRHENIDDNLQLHRVTIDAVRELSN